MKRAFLILLMASLAFSCQSDPESTLPPGEYQVNIIAKGTFNGMRAHINAIDRNKKEIAIDTAVVINEAATFSGKVLFPAIRTLSINGVKNSVHFVLEPGVTNIEIDNDNIYYSKIDGRKNNKTYNLYKEEIKKRSEAVKDLIDEYKILKRSSDTSGLSALNLKVTKQRKGVDFYAHEFIDEHSNENFSLLLLETMLVGTNHDIEKFKVNLASVKNIVNKSPENQLIGRKIQAFIAQKEAVKNVEIGRVAPNFSATTPDGKELALNDIKGKVTIIDFWASWCGPCRRENPNVVKVYEKYHDKGLEIISVSLDKPNQKNKWIQAIEKDKMDWHHVSNLKYWNEPIAKLYSVKSIPATFILDQDGKIVAKKLRGQALADQIASLLN